VLVGPTCQFQSRKSELKSCTLVYIDLATLTSVDEQFFRSLKRRALDPYWRVVVNCDPMALPLKGRWGKGRDAEVRYQ
jgi:hypothetical protein